MAIYQGNKKLAYSCNVDNSVYAVPIGTILSYSATTPPVGFLVCDGSEVSKTTYADLFEVIGDTYGTASDTTKFKLPNVKGRVLQGADGNLGTYIAESLPNITGKFYHDTNVINNTLEGAFSYTSGSSLNLANSATATSGYVEFDASKSNPIYSGEHVQQNGIAVTFIIKALKVSDKYAEEVGALIDDSSTTTDKVWSSQKISNSLIDKADKSKVADVNWTSVDISTVDENTSIKATLNYCIKNGICYMSILNIGFKTTTASEVIILGANSVPKPSSDYCWYPLVGIADPSYSVLVHPNVSGGLEHHVVGLISQVYSGSFSYPVAES